MEDFVAGQARALAACGIRRGDVIAIVMPGGAEMATLFLSVTMIACAAPLNPALSESELRFALSDLDARMLICPASGFAAVKSVASGLGIPVVELVPDDGEATGQFSLSCGESEQSSPPEINGPADHLLRLHTSGTTARPKLVGLTLSNIRESISIISETLKLERGDRSLCVMPLFHTHGLIASLCVPLAAGTSVALPGNFSAFRFPAWVEELHPTWYSAVPAVHQAILAMAERNRRLAGTARFRFIRSASAALPPVVLDRLETMFGCPVIEAYGLTETVNQICSNRFPPDQRRSGTVGQPDPETVRVIAPDGRQAGPGEPGEVVVRGPHVHAGYLDNAEANAQAFCDGWFRTGDRGVVSQDGFLTLTGRIKEIINRGGEKISPLEVESVLLEHPSISQAAVFAIPSTVHGEDIAAAIVFRPGLQCPEAAIRDFIGARLASFKMPRRIVVVEDIPKGPTGKIQRTNLAAQLEML